MELKQKKLTKFQAARRRFGAALIGMAFAAGLAGTAHAEFNKDEWVIVASVINTTNPYMASNIEGAKAISKKLGIPLEIVNSNGSSQTEISSIMAVLASGKKPIMFVNTVASSDAPTIVDAVGKAGGFVTIWWNKPEDYSRSIPAFRPASAAPRQLPKPLARRAASSVSPAFRTRPPARRGLPASSKR
jgi:ribose transport system substrate-binding protein